MLWLLMLTNFHIHHQVCYLNCSAMTFYNYTWEYSLYACLSQYVGKYYVVDVGYPNRTGYLSPYRCTRYHVEQWHNGPLVRPGAAGLLIGIECSRVWDSSWMYLTSLVTIRIGVGLAAVQRKLLDRAVVGLQLYSARTFQVTLSPGYIKVDRDPLQTIINT